MDDQSNALSNNLTTSVTKRAALLIGILAFALVLLLFLGAGHASADDVSGDITTDTTWTSGSTYNMTGYVNVYANLTIEENVTVNMDGYNINVYGPYGSMVVNGSADNWTTIMGGSIYYNDGSSGSLNYAILGDAWCALGIYSTDVTFSNLQIYDTFYGIGYEFGGSERDIALTISDVSIYNSYYGIYVQNYNGSLDVTIDGAIVNHTYYSLYSGYMGPELHWNSGPDRHRLRAH